MKAVMTTTAFMFLSMTAMGASKKTVNSFQKPDFAYPETVEKNARRVFDKASAEGNHLDMMRAAIQVTLAKSIVDRSTSGAGIEWIDSLAGISPAPWNSLYLLLEARYYTDLYSADSYTYRKRVLPLDSYPRNTGDWSKGLYCQRVTGLLERADSLLGAAGDRPITEISPLLENVGDAESLGFSIFDFIAFQSIDILATYCNEINNPVIPFGGVSLAAQTPEDRASSLRSRLIDRLIEDGDAEDRGGVATLAVICKTNGMNIADRIGVLYNEFKKRMNSRWAAPLLDEIYNCGYTRFPQVGILASHPDYDWNHSAGVFPEVPDGEAPGVKELYSLAKGYLKKFPKGWQINAVKNIERSLMTEEVALNSTDRFLPGMDITGAIAVSNVSEIVVSLYKTSLDTESDVEIDDVIRQGRRVDMQTLKFDGETPFMSRGEFRFVSPGAGNYVVVASLRPLGANDAKDYERHWIKTINVSNLAILTSLDRHDINKNRVYVVDGTDMSPVEGAEVSFYKTLNSKRVLKKTLTTNTEGFVDVSGLKDSYLVKASSKGCSAIGDYYCYQYNGRQREPAIRADVFTDLAVYKPGEKLHFAALAFSQRNKTLSLLQNKEVYCKFYDANLQKVDSVRLVTGAYGRCEGSFTVPGNGLLGTYTIVVGDEKSGIYNHQYGSNTVEVAEYKTPTFYVEFGNADESFLPGDVVRLKGLVKTYSGMPVAGASVSFDVRWSRWSGWWRNSSDARYGGKVMSDESGVFFIELPTVSLKGTRYESGCFSVTADATSPAGETQSGKTSFALGKGVRITPVIPEQLEVSGEWVRLNVPVTDILGKNMSAEVNYTIRRDSASADMLSGSFTSPELRLSSKDLPSGRYMITFTASGADTVDTEMIIFRRDDSRAPYPTPLWVPEENLVAVSGETVKVPVGSYYPDGMVLCEVMSEKGYLNRSWVKTEGRMTDVDIPAPDDSTKIWVRFTGMHDLEGKSTTVTVVPAALDRELDVKIKSFRDRLISGNQECWSFLFTVDSVAVPDIPAIGVMYNRALDAITPFDWNFNPRNGLYWNNPCSSSMTTVSELSWQNRLKGYSGYRVNDFTYPQWNMYGQRFCGWYYCVEDIACYGYASGEGVERAKVRSASMKSRSMAVNTMAQTKEVLEEEAADEVAAAPESNSGSDNGGSDNAGLRPVEMPLAFFRPLLKGDKDGVVTVEFEVPDFNTTWNFRLMGYTSELLTADIALKAVASKPVMAQSNLPRFVRTGDKTVFTATLFNNSDETMPIGGRIELFDPFTGENLLTESYDKENLAPAAGRVVSLEWDVPTDISAVGIRVYADGDGYQDGEQTAIPVLPSSTPVIESTPFYIGSGVSEKTVKLPDFPSDANVTLKYCNNPVWECILALPSITKPNSVNIFSLMKSLYGNCISAGLMKQYPGIKEALVSLKDTPEGESVLTSRIERDSELKNVELENTPWVNNAQAETQRLHALTQLGDTVRTADAIESVMRRIIALQGGDGGWSWCPKMESSVFATSGVLLHFGMLGRMGYLPTNAVPLIAPAVGYCDNAIYKDYVKHKKTFSYAGMLDYLYIRSFFEVRTTEEFSSLKKLALAEISRKWRDFDIYRKATAAILLEREGMGDDARAVLASLTQYAKKNADLGWSFENLRSGFDGWPRLITTAQALEAFSEIDPESEAVDGLRQWLVLQKVTEDWGADNYTAEVVQSILTSGTDWTNSTSHPEIKVGGRELEIGKGLPLTGEYTFRLDAGKASGKKLEIVRKGYSPAWGGVVSQYVKPIKDVKADDIPELQITKALYRVETTESGQKASGGTLEVGDRIRVTITLNCGKDMDYVTVTDSRAACLEPTDQISSYTVVDGLWMYREVRDESTNLFIPFLPKGEHVITYDCHVGRSGSYASGIATVQSQYSPLMTARSAGDIIVIE